MVKACQRAERKPFVTKHIKQTAHTQAVHPEPKKVDKEANPKVRKIEEAVPIER